jgi:hypothetical protein
MAEHGQTHRLHASRSTTTRRRPPPPSPTPLVLSPLASTHHSLRTRVSRNPGRAHLRISTVRERSLVGNVPAAGGSLGAAISAQAAHGAEPDWLAMFTSSTSDASDSSSAHNPLLLTDIDSLLTTTAALDHGSQEMERLLSLLPTQDGPLEITPAAPASLDLGVLSGHDDWSWLANDAVF